jgi:3-oxocholest-4-en-26-oate---CoA ligase
MNGGSYEQCSGCERDRYHHQGRIVTSWNFADIWEVNSAVLGGQLAMSHGSNRVTWHDFERRANGVAAHLLSAGLGHQDKVAQYLTNCPQYLETAFACFKVSLVPANTNYRYTDDELVQLWNNADAAAVVFHGTYCDIIERIRHRCPNVRSWLWVDDATIPRPRWADDYETAALLDTPERLDPGWARDGSDLLFLYTGGTTGHPRATMWEQDAVLHLILDNALSSLPTDLDEQRERVEALGSGPRACSLPVSPLMHGTGQFTSYQRLCLGGQVAMTTSRAMNTTEILDIIEAEHVDLLVMVGEAMFRPVIEAIEADRTRARPHDLSSLLIALSSGAMLSEATKDRLIRACPGVTVYDSLGSSEAPGMGLAMTTEPGQAHTAKFSLVEQGVVVADDGTLVVPGSGRQGRLGATGYLPVGYYKDPEKSAATFPVIDGVRYALPGDYATVEADGTITLLGRGSVCINTGGEKVFPEEIEEVLKMHAAVDDAVVIGLPDERWGESVNAVVRLVPGADVDAAALIAHVKTTLAAFKAPKAVVFADSVGRGPNGKVDYREIRAYAGQRLGIAAR